MICVSTWQVLTWPVSFVGSKLLRAGLPGGCINPQLDCCGASHPYGTSPAVENTGTVRVVNYAINLAGHSEALCIERRWWEPENCEGVINQTCMGPNIRIVVWKVDWDATTAPKLDILHRTWGACRLTLKRGSSVVVAARRCAFHPRLKKHVVLALDSLVQSIGPINHVTIVRHVVCNGIVSWPQNDTK